MAKQLIFDLPAIPALGREDFFVAPSNAMAVALIDGDVIWPGGKLVLSGPAGSGKTHLAHVWANRSGARIIQAQNVRDEDVPQLAGTPLVIEDLPVCANNTERLNAIFHLHNMVLANGHSLMMTGRTAPNLWALSLADLQSRVQAATHAELQAPDDSLLTVVLAKLFNDRQIQPRPDVIPYLVKRMERSFEAAADIVKAMDHVSLSENRTLTRALASQVVSQNFDTD
ncbi:MAG: chromosomal replication initiator DnaA [Paracoccaceae bacterium]